MIWASFGTFHGGTKISDITHLLIVAGICYTTDIE
jgi:hypothetical protein